MKKPLFFAIVTPCTEEPAPDIVAVTAIIDARGLYETFDIVTGQHGSAHERYIFSERAAILNPPEFAEIFPDYWKRFLETYPKYAVAPILEKPQYWKNLYQHAGEAAEK